MITPPPIKPIGMQGVESGDLCLSLARSSFQACPTIVRAVAILLHQAAEFYLLALVGLEPPGPGARRAACRRAEVRPSKTEQSLLYLRALAVEACPEVMKAVPYMTTKDKRIVVILNEARRDARTAKGVDISAADAARLFEMAAQLGEVARREARAAFERPVVQR